MSKHQPVPKNKKQLEAERLEDLVKRLTSAPWYLQLGKYQTVRVFGTPQGAIAEEVKTFDGNFEAVPQEIERDGVKYHYTGHFVDNNSHIIHLTYSD